MEFLNGSHLGRYNLDVAIGKINDTIEMNNTKNQTVWRIDCDSDQVVVLNWVQLRTLLDKEGEKERCPILSL